MSPFLARAQELRASTEPHFNCAQSVLVPFAEHAGYTSEQACAFAAAFGGGMQTGNLCGAFTGALMALGVLGMDDKATVDEFTRRMKANHNGTLLCAELLAANAKAGGERHTHCNGMVYEAVQLVEEFLNERDASEQ